MCFNMYKAFCVCLKQLRNFFCRHLLIMDRLSKIFQETLIYNGILPHLDPEGLLPHWVVVVVVDGGVWRPRARVSCHAPAHLRPVTRVHAKHNLGKYFCKLFVKYFYN